MPHGASDATSASKATQLEQYCAGLMITSYLAFDASSVTSFAFGLVYSVPAGIFARIHGKSLPVTIDPSIMHTAYSTDRMFHGADEPKDTKTAHLVIRKHGII